MCRMLAWVMQASIQRAMLERTYASASPLRQPGSVAEVPKGTITPPPGVI